MIEKPTNWAYIHYNPCLLSIAVKKYTTMATRCPGRVLSVAPMWKRGQRWSFARRWKVLERLDYSGQLGNHQIHTKDRFYNKISCLRAIYKLFQEFRLVRSPTSFNARFWTRARLTTKRYAPTLDVVLVTQLGMPFEGSTTTRGFLVTL